ncbi:MAG: hypothetical protein IT290_06090, partial [Deltaproteobacteria bacterium]|nr:hypothetical protein [Deltaproteobacteria bacterium]
MSSPDLLKSLPVQQRDFLLGVGTVAEHFGSRLFLVGGVVRDLLLGRRHAEIDVLFEKDGYRIASAVVEEWPSLFPHFEPPTRVLRFEKYLTGKLIFADDRTF